MQTLGLLQGQQEQQRMQIYWHQNFDMHSVTISNVSPNRQGCHNFWQQVLVLMIMANSLPAPG